MNNKSDLADYSKPTDFQEFKKRYLAQIAESKGGKNRDGRKSLQIQDS